MIGKAIQQQSNFSAGEVFGGLSIPPGVNDSQALLETLGQAFVPDVFNCLRGPWAAVYWQAATRTLWFGRDVLGRPLCCCIACQPLEQGVTVNPVTQDM